MFVIVIDAALYCCFIYLCQLFSIRYLILMLRSVQLPGKYHCSCAASDVCIFFSLFLFGNVFLLLVPRTVQLDVVVLRHSLLPMCQQYLTSGCVHDVCSCVLWECSNVDLVCVGAITDSTLGITSVTCTADHVF